jgi:hypothetical protein
MTDGHEWIDPKHGVVLDHIVAAHSGWTRLSSYDSERTGYKWKDDRGVLSGVGPYTTLYNQMPERYLSKDRAGMVRFFLAVLGIHLPEEEELECRGE